MLRLRQERLRRRWSLLDVAIRTHIESTNVSKIERGLLPAYPGWRHRIAEAFGLPEEVLFEEVPADDERERD